MANYIGYEDLLGEPHELCQMAKADVDAIYKDSCANAIKKIATDNKKRLKEIEQSNLNAKRLMQAYDKNDREMVADILYIINRG